MPYIHLIRRLMLGSALVAMLSACAGAGVNHHEWNQRHGVVKGIGLSKVNPMGPTYEF